MIRDELTGLLTRKSLFELLKDIQNIYVVMIDVDHFKVINDTFGHRIGDKVLSVIGNILKDMEGEGIYPIRYAGDEFVILIRKDKESLQSILESIIYSIKSYSFVSQEGDSFNVSLSFGIYSKTEKDSVEQAIRRADKALLISKSTGRDKIVFWEDIINDNIDREKDIPFVGREKAFDVLLSWYKKKKSPFLLIEGSKGQGKTRFLKEIEGFLSPYDIIFVKYYVIKGKTSVSYKSVLDIMKECINKCDVGNKYKSKLYDTINNMKVNGYAEYSEIAELFDQIVQEMKKNVLIIIDDFNWFDEADMDVMQYIIRKNKNKIRVIASVDRKDIIFMPEYTILKEIYNSKDVEIISLSNINKEEIYRALLKYYSKYLPSYVIDEIYNVTGGNPFLLSSIIENIREIDNIYSLFNMQIKHSVYKLISYFIGNLDDRTTDLLYIIAFTEKGIPASLIDTIGGVDIWYKIEQLEKDNILYMDKKGYVKIRYGIIRLGFFYLPIYRMRRIMVSLGKMDISGKEIYKIYFYMGNISKGIEKIKELLKGGIEPADLLKLISIIKDYDQVRKEKEIVIPLIDYMLKYGMDKAVDTIYSSIVFEESFEYFDLFIRYNIRKKNIVEARSLLKKVEEIYGDKEQYLPYILYRQYYLDSLEGKYKFNHYREKMEKYKNSKYYVDIYNTYINNLIHFDKNIKEAEQMATHVLSIALKMNYAIGIANIYALIGTILFKKHEFEDSFNIYKKSLEFYIKEKDISRIASIYLNMGNVLIEEGKWRSGLKHYKESLEYSRMSGSMASVARTLNNMATIYIQMNNIDTAISMIEDAFVIASDIANPRIIGITLFNKGMAYLVKKEFAMAIHNLEEASNIFENAGFRYLKDISETAIAEVLLWMGEKEWAKEKLEDLQKKDLSAEFLFYLANLEKKEINNIIEMIDKVDEDDFTKARYYFLSALYLKRINKNIALSLLMEADGLFAYLDSHKYIMEIKNLYKELSND